jgi:ABC-2 type transport system permease protein
VNVVKLFAVFFRLSAMSEMAYRANFYLQLVESLLIIATYLGIVGVVFSQTDSLGGWSPAELTGLVGVYFLVMGAINLVIAPSLQRFLEDIVTGNLDYTLVKPEDAQLLVSIGEFRVWKLIDVTLGVVVLVVAIVWQAAGIGWPTALGFGVAMLAGSAIIYSFWLMLATLAFWFIRVENILQVFWSMYLAGRWPIGIYPGWLRWTLTLVVPIAFAVTVPAEAISGRASAAALAGAVLLALGLLAASRWFWRHGLKHYSGASA